jgi:glutamate racemase
MSIDFAFLDSGTGGIPYMQYLKSHFPDYNCVYLADSKNFPYGEKSPSDVISCATNAAKLIVNTWNPKALIIACNTISVIALDNIRKALPNTPIVGTVPAIKLAASLTQKKVIGLLATNAAVNNPYVKELARKFAEDCEVVYRGDPELISFIEHKSFTATKQERLEAVKPAVKFMKDKGCDAIILGCTHFLNLADEFAEVAGPTIKIVDSREGVVKQAIKVQATQIEENKKSDSSKNVLDKSLFVTGFTSSDDEKEYGLLCKNLNIPWGGLIK